MTDNVSLPVRTTPPGPRQTFPGQHLIEMMRKPLPLVTRAAQYGDVSYLHLGAKGGYLINRPEYIQGILVNNHRLFIKSAVLQRMRDFLGEGLLTSEGELHLRQRRLIQPAFHRQKIAAYGKIMTDNALLTSERWQDGETRDIHKEMMRLTMLVVGEALFGANVEGEAAEIGTAITTLLENSRRLMLPFYQQYQRLPLPGNRAANEAGLFIDQRIRQMINARRKAQNNGADEPPGDLMDMLLRARDVQGDGKGMSDELVRDEVMTLFLAGHETTANALTWTWYLLSQNPEVEARLHAELEQVLGGRLPTAEDSERLPYTRKVLSEAMRLYPPAWIIGRQALEDYAIDDLVIPAGATVLMSQWVMHHDQRFFPDPNRFDPERWTPEAMAARPRFSYFPFGGGPRLCIGEPFAWMEGALLLAALAQRWQLRLDPNQRIGLLPQITLRPKYGMRMVLTKR